MELKPGIFAIYKPIGPNSHDVLDSIKREFRGEKVGHAGTLDPLASGVLVVGVGREATKLLHGQEFAEKEYRSIFKLGAYSTTDDEEGAKTLVENAPPISESQVQAALKKFTGSIMQVPPVYSAVKVGGTASYKRARSGKEVALSSRPVLVKSIELQDYRPPLLTLEIVTGPGVYIRSLARDLGKKLGTGAYVTALERTRVGRFTLKDAVRLS
jgi:tRNA pseudouridine55 synthase